MRPTFVVLAGLLLASPATAAYGPVPETLPDAIPTVTEVSPCMAARHGFLSLRERMAARQPDAERKMVINVADNPAQLILALGFLQKQNQTAVRETFFAPNPPMKAVIVFSFTFLQGLSEMDDQVGVAIALTVAEAKGVCARG